ncbi:MAG: nicotinate phosphoribosyltransferase, partial [Actinobacteria bacterium]|nr:nicotinate phosphoribosyltransferase [Actinomycetota bacterium]
DGVPVDSFGVGTQLGTSADAPTLGGVYKLVADDRGPKIKLSAGKATLPGCKQIYRFEKDGIFERDVIALHDEPSPGGRPLLSKVVDQGRRTTAPDPIQEVRARCLSSLDKLPNRLRRLGEPAESYRVTRSHQLSALVDAVRNELR